MLVRYIVVTAHNHSPKVTPKALNAIGEHVTVGILFSTMSNNSVSITKTQDGKTALGGFN